LTRNTERKFAGDQIRKGKRKKKFERKILLTSPTHGREDQQWFGNAKKGGAEFAAGPAARRLGKRGGFPSRQGSHGRNRSTPPGIRCEGFISRQGDLHESCGVKKRGGFGKSGKNRIQGGVFSPFRSYPSLFHLKGPGESQSPIFEKKEIFLLFRQRTLL